jgi:hypothetical protein
MKVAGKGSSAERAVKQCAAPCRKWTQNLRRIDKVCDKARDEFGGYCGKQSGKNHIHLLQASSYLV